MRKLLYYLPGQRSVDEAVCRGAGLIHSATGCGFATRYVGRDGPDGKEGALFVLRFPGETLGAAFAERIKYMRTEQTWTPCLDGRVWMGYWNDEKPGPEDLARAGQRPGHMVRLSDGAEWCVPIIFPHAGGSVLPQSIALDASGELVAEDLPEYAELRAGADEVFEYYFRGSDEGLPYLTALRTVGLAMSLNYYAGPWECSALRLFTTDNVMMGCRAIIDFATIERVYAGLMESQKKTASTGIGDSSSIDCGCADDCLVTGLDTSISI